MPTEKPKTWIAKLVEKCLIAEGEMKGKIDVEKAKLLAKHNGVNIDNLKTDTGSDLARIRMTLTNTLTGRARKRHALKDVNGRKVTADADWLEANCKDQEPTETIDGVKIEKKKDKKPDAPAAADAKGTAKKAA